MKKEDLKVLGSEDVFHLIGSEWMLVTAGDGANFNTMTASWGGFGWLWNKPVAFVFIRPERYTHGFVDASERLTLSFFPETMRKALQICGTKSGRDTDKVKESGLTPTTMPSGAIAFEEARMVLDCRKLFKTDMEAANFIDAGMMKQWYDEKKAGGGFHSVYIVEIESVYTN